MHTHYALITICIRIICFKAFLLILQAKSTPLHLAVEYGWYQACMLLEKHGANVDAKNKVSFYYGCFEYAYT